MERTSPSDGGKSADQLTALVPDFRLYFFLDFPFLCDVSLRRSTLAHISWQRQRELVSSRQPSRPAVLSI